MQIRSVCHQKYIWKNETDSANIMFIYSVTYQFPLPKKSICAIQTLKTKYIHM